MLILRHEPCPVCESTKRKLLGSPGKTSEVFRTFPQASTVCVVRCMDCTAMYVSPMTYFSEELRKQLYSLDYFVSNGEVEGFKNIGEKQDILKIVKELSGGTFTGKTLLDIGCGTGEFLKTAADLGMNVTGIDVDPSITEYIRQKYGFNTVTGLLTRGTVAAASFDVVVLSHVIEHLQKPADLLAVIHSILKPGGLFVMCTPNADSLMEDLHNVYGRVFHDKSKVYYLTPFKLPYHIVGFNIRSARRILERTGFAPEYCKLRSGLEWADSNRKIVMRSIKVAGALLGKGMSIVTVSRKIMARTS